MTEKIFVSKEEMIPLMLEMMQSKINAQMKSQGLTGLKITKLEWTNEGLIVLFNLPAKHSNKTKRK